MTPASERNEGEKELCDPCEVDLILDGYLGPKECSSHGCLNHRYCIGYESGRGIVLCEKAEKSFEAAKKAYDNRPRWWQFWRKP